LPRNPLQNDDASLYALAAKNAVIHNQWLAQFVSPGDSTSFLDKPPLGIWLLAWPMKLLGVSELTVHIPNVLYFTLLLLILYLTLSRLAAKKVAFYSTLITATSLGLVVYSRAPKLDILLPLFVLTAHLSLYAFLKRNNTSYLIPFTLSLAAGFLIKSGFALILPALTILFLLIFSPPAREKLFKVRITHYALLVSFLLLIVAGVLALQAIPLGEQWLPYLRSITIQSKYNTSYLGFGCYYSIIGFLLLILFPWSALWLSSVKVVNPYPPSPSPLLRGKGREGLGVKVRTLSLSSFCSLWFWSNFLFLLFFYRQSDLRTFTVFVPPLAILAGIRLASLLKQRRGFLAPRLWNAFFLFLFSATLVVFLLKPQNADGFDLSAALVPLGILVASLAALQLFLWRPDGRKLLATFALAALGYSVLFWNSQTLVRAFNPDLNWPKTITRYRAEGNKFFIYRPPDRKLFFSPDLFYVDFMAGPADKYFWDGDKLQKNIVNSQAILLSDTESLNKLKLTSYVVLARDNYSTLALTEAIRKP